MAFILKKIFVRHNRTKRRREISVDSIKIFVKVVRDDLWLRDVFHTPPHNRVIMEMPEFSSHWNIRIATHCRPHFVQLRKKRMPSCSPRSTVSTLAFEQLMVPAAEREPPEPRSLSSTWMVLVNVSSHLHLLFCAGHETLLIFNFI